MIPFPKMPANVSAFITSQLCRALPSPHDDRPETRETRDVIAMASIARLGPDNTMEAAFAVQAVGAQAHATRCLEAISLYQDDFQKAAQCRTQSAVMMRQAAQALKELRTLQEDRAVMLAFQRARAAAAARGAEAEADEARAQAALAEEALTQDTPAQDTPAQGALTRNRPERDALAEDASAKDARAAEEQAENARTENPPAAAELAAAAQSPMDVETQREDAATTRQPTPNAPKDTIDQKPLSPDLPRFAQAGGQYRGQSQGQPPWVTEQRWLRSQGAQHAPTWRTREVPPEMPPAAYQARPSEAALIAALVPGTARSGIASIGPMATPRGEQAPAAG